MKEDVRPLFIFSLPRSGSTLLQRTLASHPKISTTAETWFLLPLIYMLQDNGVKTEYGYSKFRKGFSDFRDQVNANDEASYEKLLRQFVLNNYKLASNNNTTFFLDKTPRYSLICDKIIEMFPDGKFIFLWRNPLAVVSSMIESWGAGKWNVNKYYIDLYKGLNNLIDTRDSFKNRILEVNYEAFVNDPSKKIKEILKYLELGYIDNLMDRVNRISFQGKMGDQIGVKKYPNISNKSVSRWINSFDNPLRKIWAYKYLDSIGEKKLNKIGYNILELKNELDDYPNDWLGLSSDIMRLGYGITKEKIKSKIFSNG